MLVVLLATVIYTDWRWMRIPNVVTYPTMLAGLALGALEALPGALFDGGLLDHAGALVLAFAVAYPFYLSGGLKAGDAKLLMAMGAVRGLTFFLYAAVYGALIGGVLAIGVIVRRRLAPAPENDPDASSMSRLMRSSMPYGVALGLGGLLTLLLEATGRIGP